MSKKSKLVDAYLAKLPAAQRVSLEKVRAIILKNLDRGYEEGLQYGMPAYYVPHKIYPSGYHCNPKEPLPFMSFAAQKKHLALYLMFIYAPEVHSWFRKEWAKSGKKLDAGKCCIRFKKLEELDLPTLEKAIKCATLKKYIAQIEGILSLRKKK